MLLFTSLLWIKSLKEPQFRTWDLRIFMDLSPQGLYLQIPSVGREPRDKKTLKWKRRSWQWMGAKEDHGKIDTLIKSHESFSAAAVSARSRNCSTVQDLQSGWRSRKHWLGCPSPVLPLPSGTTLQTKGRMMEGQSSLWSNGISSLTPINNTKNQNPQFPLPSALQMRQKITVKQM